MKKYLNDNELQILDHPKLFKRQARIRNKQFWVSIIPAKDCLFSRRNGYIGKLILGYSVCVRLFGYDLL